jgi:hypothetical protein
MEVSSDDCCAGGVEVADIELVTALFIVGFNPEVVGEMEEEFTFEEEGREGLQQVPIGLLESGTVDEGAGDVSHGAVCWLAA